MAHSFVEACNSEEEAFLGFARANRDNVVLLIDTYDTEAGAAKVVKLAPKLASEGITIRAVRLDSGDLAEHARQVRQILDAGGLGDMQIVASGNLDEYELHRLVQQKCAPIDSFGVGTRVLTSADVPYLDCVYKLQEYAGQPRFKRSEGKATWPGRKQVYRSLDVRGRMAGDAVTLEGDIRPGEPLLEAVMQNGHRLAGPSSLSEIRTRIATQLAQLPEALLSLETSERPYGVLIAEPLQKLTKGL